METLKELRKGELVLRHICQKVGVLQEDLRWIRSTYVHSSFVAMKYLHLQPAIAGVYQVVV
jgi:hypothetical protein